VKRLFILLFSVCLWSSTALGQYTYTATPQAVINLSTCANPTEGQVCWTEFGGGGGKSQASAFGKIIYSTNAGGSRLRWDADFDDCP
jgi:hypothetical protein